MSRTDTLIHIKYAVESDSFWDEIDPKQSQKLNSKCIFNVTIFKTERLAEKASAEVGDREEVFYPDYKAKENKMKKNSGLHRCV